MMFHPKQLAPVFLGIVIGTLISSLVAMNFQILTYSSHVVTKIEGNRTTNDEKRELAHIPRNAAAEAPPKTERINIPAKVETATKILDPVVAKVRVVCWIMTYPKKHNTSARTVKETWGKRCDKLVFISSKNDKSLPSVAVNVIEERKYLWGKTKRGFEYVYKHHYKDGDWFMKADDDTYVVVENLKLMLSKFNPDLPVYFGCNFKKFTKQGYTSGGGGYVLSRKALKRVVTEAFGHRERCKISDAGAEDAEMGKCLYNVGVKLLDSRDARGSYRFWPLDINSYANHNVGLKWFWEYISFPVKNNEDCCSSTPISWHYISPKTMYVLDYLIYKVRPYGYPSPISNVKSRVLLNPATIQTQNIK